MVSVCCSCHKVKIGNCWMKKNIIGQVVTSGYCPECFRKTLAAIESFGGGGGKGTRQGRAVL